jgi:DNA-binding response OmpR family regulator
MDRAANKHRATIKVVLADGDTYTSQALRNALTNEGYGDVRAVARLFALRDVMMTAMADLLVLDVDLPDGNALGLVRDIRQGRLGRNPFLPIILLTWASEPRVVQRAVNSGIDLILVKPISPVQLFSRIDGLVAHRKPFVVTADYVGPDRRDHGMSGPAERYDVPNTLRDKMEGRQIDPAALSDRIDAALNELKQRQFSQAVEKFAGAIDVVCPAIEADEITDELEDEFDDLCRLTRDIADIGGPDVRKLCKPLLKVLHTIRADIDEVDPKQAELLRPLADTVLLAANRTLSFHPVMAEIDQALSSIAPEEAEEDDALRAATWGLSR